MATQAQGLTVLWSGVPQHQAGPLRAKAQNRTARVAAQWARANGYAVASAPCHEAEPYAYADALSTFWPQDHPLLVWEGDVLPSQEALEALVDCHKGFGCCAVPYRLQPSHTGLDREAWSARRVFPANDTIGRPESLQWVSEADDYADLTGLGMTLIRPWILKPDVLQPGSPKPSWRGLDTILSRDLAPIHLHWKPIRHLPTEPAP